MGFMDLVKLRKSVRAYVPGQELDTHALTKILEAARFAPSAKNLQEWKFIVVRDKSTLAKLVPACKDQKFIAEVSAVIVGCSDNTDYVMTCGQPAYTVDLAIALEHMALMAADLGIGSCWIGAFYEDRVKEILNIPAKVRVVNLLTLGHPAQELSKIVTTTRTVINSDDYIFKPTRNNYSKETNKPLHPTTINYIIDFYVYKAGITKQVSPHSCRATVISSLLDNKVGIRDVAVLVGHSSIQTTSIYDKRKNDLNQSASYKIHY